jgi:predicted GTPase
MKEKVIIMGAAGRDFHNFNIVFRNNPHYQVVAFTAAQIPGIAGRKYPPILSGKLYPKGIPIFPEEQLAKLVKKYNVKKVVLAYSDLPYFHVMHKASLAASLGADFLLIGPNRTMLKSKKPVIAVTAVRTGCGKSPTTRLICQICKKMAIRAVVIRHPMPYGNLAKQVVQKFSDFEDMDRQKCTIEEREEYEPLIKLSITVFAGIDYKKILRAAERQCDVIIFDGGNNDWPLIKPNLHIVLVDPLRPGHEISYWPGEVNLRMADIVIINKISSAKKSAIKRVEANIAKYNKNAKIFYTDSTITVSNPKIIKNKFVLVIEDGPTLTHGGMAWGAGLIACKKYHAIPINPRKWAVGSIRDVYNQYPHIGPVLPAMGYSEKQIKELELTANKVPCQAIVSGTPIDLRRVIKTNKPIVRISYELSEKGKFEQFIKKFLSTI